MKTHRRPCGGHGGILRACKAAGYPLYGLSNWAQEKFDLIRPKYDFFDCFDDILISSTVNLVKPDPRIFEIFLARIDARLRNVCISTIQPLTWLRPRGWDSSRSDLIAHTIGGRTRSAECAPFEWSSLMKAGQKGTPMPATLQNPVGALKNGSRANPYCRQPNRRVSRGRG